ncbi:hypothetical protein DSECCO2_663150 [anaerobic digester metagenome]
MCRSPAPLSIINRIISMKWAIGLKKVSTFAQPGMLSIGVNNPLSSIKITSINHEINMDCCCVFTRVEIKSPKPVTTSRNKVATRKISVIFPKMGIWNKNLAKTRPKASSDRPIIQKGINFPAINCVFRRGVTLICSMVPISFSRTTFIPERNMPIMVTSSTSIPGTINVL